MTESPPPDPVAEGLVTDTADLISDQSETVADRGPDAAPPHEVDQSETVADRGADAAPEHLVDPPPPPEEAFPQPPASEPVPVQALIQPPTPQEGTRMVKWLGVAGISDKLSRLRLADNPDVEYKPGDEVPLSDAQIASLRATGDHLFEGDDALKPTPGG